MKNRELIEELREAVQLVKDSGCTDADSVSTKSTMKSNYDRRTKAKRRNQFREARLHMGLSQGQLAPLIGISANNISYVETGGKRGTAPTKQQIAAMRNLLFICSHSLLQDLIEKVNKS